MIPRLRPEIGLAEIVAAFSFMGSVQRFEQSFADLMEQRHAIAFPYGRTGLLLLLQAMGIKGRQIICPAYTCVVVAHAIVLSGNHPVFIDSCDDDFNMDLDRAEDAVCAQTAVIVATSIHGYPVDLERLAKFRQRFPRVRVIQDCAHSFAAKWRGRSVQTEGDAAVFGLNVSKILTSIFGGVVTTDNDALASRLRSLRDARLTPATWLRSFTRATYLAVATAALFPTAYSVVDKLRRLHLIDRFTEYYHPEVIDMPSDHLVAMCAAEAAVGIVQTRKYDAIIARRQRLASIYDDELRDCRHIRRPPLVPGATYSHYVPRVAEPDKVLAQMARTGIELGRVIDYCVPDMPAYRSYMSSEASFPVARRLNSEVLNLPLHLSEPAARRVARGLSAVLDRAHRDSSQISSDTSEPLSAGQR